MPTRFQIAALATLYLLYLTAMNSVAPTTTPMFDRFGIAAAFIVATAAVSASWEK